MKLPSFSSFLKWEFYSNVTGALLSPCFLYCLNYLLDDEIMKLDTPRLLLLLNGAPLVLALIKSTIADNCYPARRERDQEQVRSNNTINATAAIIMHGLNTAGGVTGNNFLTIFNQSALPLVAYMGGNAINHARKLVTSTANMWTQRQQQVMSNLIDDIESPSQQQANQENQENQPLL